MGKQLLPEKDSLGAYCWLKRWIDVLASVILLIITLPLLSLAALLIKLDGGPVLFRARRVGKNGREFTLLKLRTMVKGADCMEHEICREHLANGGYGIEGNYIDPRVTRVGAILRFLNIDELPQLLNIIKGDMSLVGPRPVPYEESLLYGSKREHVLSVRPGLTGYWQVKRRISTTYDERVAMDCYYVDHRSLWLDAKILLLTPISMILSDYNSLSKPLPPMDRVLISERAESLSIENERTIEALVELEAENRTSGRQLD